jgi:hypothetical protein
LICHACLSPNLPDFTTANSQSQASAVFDNGQNYVNLALQKGLFHHDDLG